MQVSTYSSIRQLGDRVTRRMFDGGPLVAQEKVDGSQFSFANVGGKLLARSKNNSVGEGGNAEGMFGKAYETADAIFRTGTLEEGTVVRCEVVSKPKHNVLRYDRIPTGSIILYDMETPQRSANYASPELLKRTADMWGIEVVPTFAYETFTLESLREILPSWLQRTSILGGTLIEGVVVKNYRVMDEEDNVLMAKYVSEQFKEKMDPTHVAKVDALTPVQKILSGYQKEAIWNKAVQHLRDNGDLLNTPKDIGKLVAEIKSDFTKENKEDIVEAIVDAYYGDVVAGILNGFPQWYKTKMLEADNA